MLWQEVVFKIKGRTGDWMSGAKKDIIDIEVQRQGPKTWSEVV